MGWDNSTKDCKFAPICAGGIRCGASEENPMECYRKDKRTWLQKIFQKSSHKAVCDILMYLFDKINI